MSDGTWSLISVTLSALILVGFIFARSNVNDHRLWACQNDGQSHSLMYCLNEVWGK